VLLVALVSRLRNWKQALLITQLDTVVRWHQDLYRWLWRIISKPPAAAERAGGTHPAPSAERIRGDLLMLGIGVAKSTILKYIRRVREPTGLTRPG
jgi:hypothetical protein